MIAALDVHYANSTAHAAAVVFRDWRSRAIIARYTAAQPAAADYEPGQFYLRELAPLLAVTQRIQEDINAFFIDGYCHLSADFAPGLGAHLSNALAQSAAIIGVAKNRYRD